MKDYDEYALKNVYLLVREDEVLMGYMPKEEMEKERWPDREWFWNIANTHRKVWVDQYMAKVEEQRETHKKELPKAKHIDVADDWVEKLTRFPNESCAKKGQQSIFIQREVKDYKKSEKERLKAPQITIADSLKANKKRNFNAFACGQIQAKHEFENQKGEMNEQQKSLYGTFTNFIQGNSDTKRKIEERQDDNDFKPRVNTDQKIRFKLPDSKQSDKVSEIKEGEEEHYEDAHSSQTEMIHS